MPKPKQPINAGDMYGYLTVLHEAEAQPGKKRAIVVQCRCGKTLSVLAQNLLSRRSTSCGCKRSETATSYKKAYWSDRGSKMRSTDAQ